METTNSSREIHQSNSHYEKGSNNEPYIFWTFRMCPDRFCRHGLARGNHLIIVEESIDAGIFNSSTRNHANRPFAISYAWGLKPHKKQYIGHSPDGKAYHVELGQEWDRGKFVERLDFHSKIREGGLRPGWLDQISNKKHDKQGSKENPTAINQIPQIYRRCEVIALFPGSHCRCLYGDPTPDCLNYINLVSWWSRLWPRQEFMYATKISTSWANAEKPDECLVYKEILAKSDKKELTYLCGVQYEEFFWLQARSQGRPCSNGSCRSFLNRRPHLALEVMLISWAHKLEPPKVASISDVARVVEKMFGPKKPRKQITCPCQIALTDIRAYQQAHLRTMNMAMEEKQPRLSDTIQPDDVLPGTESQTRPSCGFPLNEFRPGTERQTRPSDAIQLDAFLQGTEICTPECGDTDKLRRFWFHLGIVSRSNREVTKVKDLVAAVWPECPDYKYTPLDKNDGLSNPKNLNQAQRKIEKQKKERESFLKPLRDGLSHLKKAPGHALITTAPYGLFKQSNAWKSWEWVPEEYMGCKASSEDWEPFPGTTSYAYGTMASPFVPVPIEGVEGHEFLALEYHENPQSWKSLLASSQLLEERFPILQDGRDQEQTGSETIEDFVKSVVEDWPRQIRHRCLGPQRLILERLLKNTNILITENVAPTVAIDFATNLAIGALYITRFILCYRASLIVLLTLATGKDETSEELGTLARVLDVMDKVIPKKVQKMAIKKLEGKRGKQHDQLYLSQPMQTARDQDFLDTAVRPEQRRRALKFDNSGEKRVNYLDTIYYMVAEALGFRPGDLGLDYNQSFENGGKSYVEVKPVLVVSEGFGRPMLGLMSRSCERRSGQFMTVAFKDGDKGEVSDKEAETCLYEVEMITEQRGSELATWRIVGVWVPVKSSATMGMVSGWFGPAANTVGKLL